MSDYPTAAELRKIKKWAAADFDFLPLMEYVRSIWWSPEWGFRGKGRHFKVSTGGWSGNEDIMGALHENWAFWSLCWVQSRRGGHYRFHVPKVKKAPVKTAPTHAASEGANDDPR